MASTSNAVIPPTSAEIDEIYSKKLHRLQEKHDSVRLQNDKFKNRLYHVKKEIKYLKRLKRILIQRLYFCNDRFMDACLEIPDNEPGSNVEDQIIAEVARSGSVSLCQSTKRRSKPDSKRQQPEVPVIIPIVNTQLFLEAETATEELQTMAVAAKESVWSIIDSVITEARAARSVTEEYSSYVGTPEQPLSNEPEIKTARDLTESVESALGDVAMIE